MATVFLDKVAEILGLFAFSLFGLLVFSSVISNKWHIWLILILMTFTTVISIWGLKGRLGAWLSQRFDQLLMNRFHLTNQRRISKLHQEFQSIQIITWLQVAGLTLLRRLSHYLAVYLLALALGINISYITIVAIMSLVGMAVVMPIAVAGGLGVREGVLVSLFALLDQPKELAVSLALLIFIIALVSRGVGMIYWMKNPLGNFKKEIIEDTSETP